MRRGAPRKYDWERWLSDPSTTLMRGIDYRCSQSAMAYQIRNAASRRRIRVRLTDTGDAITIEVVGEVPYTDKATIAG